jgi:hypothetical protein
VKLLKQCDVLRTIRVASTVHRWQIGIAAVSGRFLPRSAKGLVNASGRRTREQHTGAVVK